MVPYDRDLDLVVDETFWNTTSFWRIMQKLQESYGYEYNLVEDYKLKIYYSKENRIDIDLWAYFVKNEEFYIVYRYFKAQRVETMMPFQDVEFEWFRIFVPNTPREYLNKQYGKERWEIEKQCMVRDAEDNCW